MHLDIRSEQQQQNKQLFLCVIFYVYFDLIFFANKKGPCMCLKGMCNLLCTEQGKIIFEEKIIKRTQCGYM